MKIVFQISKMFKINWNLRQNINCVNNSSNWTLNAIVRNNVKIKLNKIIDALIITIINVYNTSLFVVIDVYTTHRFSSSFIFYFTSILFIQKIFTICNFIIAFVITFDFLFYFYCYCVCNIQILFFFEFYCVLQIIFAFFNNFCFNF